MKCIKPTCIIWTTVTLQFKSSVKYIQICVLARTSRPALMKYGQRNYKRKVVDWVRVACNLILSSDVRMDFQTVCAPQPSDTTSSVFTFPLSHSLSLVVVVAVVVVVVGILRHTCARTHCLHLTLIGGSDRGWGGGKV